MAYRIDNNPTSNNKCLVIDGFEKGISQSPYTGIANIKNLNTSYYSSVAYLNYRRQASVLTDGHFFAGIHSINVSNNLGWQFTSPSTIVMGNPVAKAVSPAGLNYVLDTLGQVWKQNSVNSPNFSIIEDGTGRFSNGAGGLAYWNNYIVVFGNGVIEFCGNGTGDSGIVATNWNLNGGSFLVGSSTVSFMPQQFQLSAVPSGATYTGGTLSSLNSYPTGVSANWGYPTNTNATITLSTGQVITGCTVTNGSSTFSTPSTVITGSPNTLVTISSASLYYTPLTPLIQNGAQIIFANTGTLPSPLVAGQVYYATGSPSPLSIGGYVFSVSATLGGSAIIVNTPGSGTITFSVAGYIPFPIGNVTNLTFTSGINPGATTATINTYTTPSGLAAIGVWVLPTGVYNLVDPNGNNILATFTNGSTTVNFINAINQYIVGTSNSQVQILNTNTTNYKTYISKSDGNLYFCNGNSVGRFYYNPATNLQFNPSNPASYLVKYAAVQPTIHTDTIVDMADISGQLLFAGQYDVYVWDYVAVQPNATRPVGEKVSSIINLLNNVYILAGQKGNIYISNGYSVQLFLKIPDYISGVIDPVFSWGDLMVHRSRLYFQILVQNTSGTNILAGIFSLVVSPSQTGIETPGALVMEAQNSYGLVPAVGALSNGLLMDNEPSSNGQDSYYSAWSNGATTGGIDYNDTTVWQNFEPTIETDIIPIGTILEKQSFGLIEFKLDRPMVTGDQIKLYWRPSLSDSYVLMGTTSTNQLSEYYTSNITQSQWAQFMVTFKGASSNTSFIPLREIRLNYGNQ